MTADAAPVLLELATSGPKAFRVRCLRGYIRIPRQLKVDDDQRLAMCRKALAAHATVELALAVFGVSRYRVAGGCGVHSNLVRAPGERQRLHETRRLAWRQRNKACATGLSRCIHADETLPGA